MTSGEVTVQIICPLGLIIPTVTTFSTSINEASLSPNDRYLFSAFTCPAGFTACCSGTHALSYKLSSSNVLAGNSFSVAGIQNPVVPGFYVTISDTLIVTTYTFYLFAVNDYD